MREIKFRVWVEAPDGEQAMHYPKLVSFGSGQLSWATLQDDNVIKDNGWYSKREVMQYTGLKDKNGKEVWEGDIVTLDYVDEDGEAIRRYAVIFEEGAFYGQFKSGNYQSMIWGNDFNDTEVIGNIYENPELLAPTASDTKNKEE